MRKEITSGTTSNVLVMFTNHAYTEKEFEIKLSASGFEWKQILNFSSVKIDSNSVLNKIITIRIPEYVRAGDYDIVLEAFEKPQNVSFGRVSIPIRVKPRYQIVLERTKAPRHILSGDSVILDYSITNMSNTDVSVIVSVMNGVVPDDRFLSIPQDSTIITKVQFASLANLESNTQQNVSVAVAVKDIPETLVYSNYVVDVIPSNNAKFDAYNRYPVSISAVLATTNRSGPQYYGFMYDIKGSGIIMEESKHAVDFQFRGPDRRGDPLLGLTDLYNITYRTPKSTIILGDYNFSLSSLSESSRLGRGIKLIHQYKEYTFGGFFHVPRYFPGIKSTYSLYSGYSFNDRNKIQAGFIAKVDTLNKTAGIFTASGDLKPLPWLKTDLELALGSSHNKVSMAAKAVVNVNTSYLNSYLTLMYADPLFPGYISNTLILSSGISANATKKIGLALNYNLNASNMALDTIYANAPYSETMSLNANYRLKPNSSVGFSLNSVGMEDRAQKKMFDYQKYFGRTFWQGRYNRIDINFLGEYGLIENYLVQNEDVESPVFYSTNLGFKYALNNIFSVSGFVNYQGGQQYLVTGIDKFYYGGSLFLNLKKTFASLDFQSNYELKDYYRDRSLFSLHVQHLMKDIHEFEISANYNMAKNTLNKRELSVQIRYTYKLNFPISKKKNLGSLSGKLINKGAESVDGIVFRIDGNITMTDKQGKFGFPLLPIGKYNLFMDDSEFPLYTIAGTPGPYKIEIKSGEETKFETSLTKAAIIQGRLVIQEDENLGQKGFYPVKDEIDKLIVEVSNGSEIFRNFTQRDGSYVFSDLRPGKWTLKVYKTGIPDGYNLVKETFDLEISPGERVVQDVLIHKKTRVIKLQQKFNKK